MLDSMNAKEEQQHEKDTIELLNPEVFKKQEIDAVGPLP